MLACFHAAGSDTLQLSEVILKILSVINNVSKLGKIHKGTWTAIPKFLYINETWTMKANINLKPLLSN